MSNEPNNMPEVNTGDLPKPNIVIPDFSSPPQQSPSPLGNSSPFGGMAAKVEQAVESAVESVTESAQSVVQEVQQAIVPTGLPPLVNRIIAVVIDTVIYIFIVIILAMVLPGFLGRISFLAGLAYFLLRDCLPFLGGQSIGKKIMKLRAVTMDGKSLSGNWQAGLVRSAVLLIPVFPIVELVTLFTREGKPEAGRRLGDDWAQTKVITDNGIAA
jgi:uncharacterized RDD family membrane protein YckC